MDGSRPDRIIIDEDQIEPIEAHVMNGLTNRVTDNQLALYNKLAKAFEAKHPEPFVYPPNYDPTQGNRQERRERARKARLVAKRNNKR